MDTCMIKDCKKNGTKEGLCEQHFMQIVVKAAPNGASQTPTNNGRGAHTNGVGRKPLDDVGGKSEFLMLSLMGHAEKFTNAMVSSFDTFCKLSASESADIYRRIGERSLSKGDRRRAISALKKEVELRPADGVAWYRLGAAYLDEGAIGEAIACLENSVELDPTPEDSYLSLGLAYARGQMVDQAIESLQKARELNAESAEVHHHLGMLLDEKEHYEEAISSLEKAAELDPNNADYQQSLGLVYESVDNHKEAVKRYKKAFALQHR